MNNNKKNQKVKYEGFFLFFFKNLKLNPEIYDSSFDSSSYIEEALVEFKEAIINYTRGFYTENYIDKINIIIEKLQKDEEGIYFKYLLFEEKSKKLHTIISYINSINFEGDLLNNLLVFKKEFLDYKNSSKEQKKLIQKNFKKNYNNFLIRQLEDKIEFLKEENK